MQGLTIGDFDDFDDLTGDFWTLSDRKLWVFSTVYFNLKYTG
jgi:hypothetical protein